LPQPGSPGVRRVGRSPFDRLQLVLVGQSHDNLIAM
jgi:hypothetical protein